MVLDAVAESERDFLAGLEPLDNAFRVPIDRIRRWPGQPREWFDPIALAELVASVREHGIKQPVILRPDYRPQVTAGGFLITIGERRWRAAREAGLAWVPALIEDTSTKDALVDSLTENIQRKDLTSAEELRALRQLLTLQLAPHEIASRLGLTRETIARRIRVLDDEVLGPAVSDNQISLTEAFELLPLRDVEQKHLLAIIVERKRSGIAVTRDALRRLVEQARAQQRPTLTATNSARPMSVPSLPPTSPAVDSRQYPEGLKVAVTDQAPFPVARPIISYPGVSPAPVLPADQYKQGGMAVPSAATNSVGGLSAPERRAAARLAWRARDLRRHVELNLSVICASDGYNQISEVAALLQDIRDMLDRALARP